jgi:hypothetical protein
MSEQLIVPGEYGLPIVRRSVMRRARRRAHELAMRHYPDEYRAFLLAMLEQLEAGALRPEQIDRWEPEPTCLRP